MATASVHSLISNEKLGGSIPAVPSSLHIIHPIPQTRYESDEEAESELNIPVAREDRLFSPPNADCDIVIGSRGTTDHAERGFELTMPLSEEQQKLQQRRQGPADVPNRSSLYTVRRISGLTLLPPLQTSPEQLQQHEQQRNASRSRSPSATPRNRTERPATMIFEQEEFEDPVYSDHSDHALEYDADVFNDSDLGDDTDVDIQDGGPIHESFFVATPVTYHLPKGRPNLVSISPPPSRSGRSSQAQTQRQMEEQSPRAQKKQKKQSGPASLERPDAALKRNSSTSSSIRRSLQHLKVKKSDSRRGSAYISTEPTPVPPVAVMNASTNTSPMSATSPPDSAKFFTETKKTKQSSSDGRRRSLIPNQLRSGRRDRNVSEQQTPPPTDTEAPPSQRYNNNTNTQNEPEQTQIQGHRRRATEKLSSFNKVAWTPASPPTSPEYNNSAQSSNSHPPAPQKPPVSSDPEPAPPTPGLRKTKTLQVPPPNNSLDQLPVPRNRARTRSISSIASNASKFSLPAFDSASLKAIARKYQNRTASPTPSGTSNLRPTTTLPDSDRRPSDCGSTMSERPSVPSYRHNKFLRTMSTTNLSMLTSAQDTIDEDTMGGPYQSKFSNSSLGRKSKRYSITSKASISTGRSSSTSSNNNNSTNSTNAHIRSKSIKWFQGTSESMSIAGNKLGSILKKKSVALPTTS
ncbi:hypothetical protein H109_00421 [Trichophyton interdigitale MR816]|uniref:Uncharacterized protein n=1 Tax=Trichophyton interdigitale (strain MR816) TaxID=1215338 RepID=A0A059JJ84_TRIIM|nr:hypothetical protein H101_06277 [Trichophyton interdigitale H6]KDB27854.1 hypothetical protein H109_00421 [Trichophyton interdigitale MR816]